jgi:hypothetical protein
LISNGIILLTFIKNRDLKTNLRDYRKFVRTTLTSYELHDLLALIVYIFFIVFISKIISSHLVLVFLSVIPAIPFVLRGMRIFPSFFEFYILDSNSLTFTRNLSEVKVPFDRIVRFIPRKLSTIYFLDLNDIEKEVIFSVKNFSDKNFIQESLKEKIYESSLTDRLKTLWRTSNTFKILVIFNLLSSLLSLYLLVLGLNSTNSLIRLDYLDFSEVTFFIPFGVLFLFSLLNGDNRKPQPINELDYIKKT